MAGERDRFRHPVTVEREKSNVVTDVLERMKYVSCIILPCL